MLGGADTFLTRSPTRIRYFLRPDLALARFSWVSNSILASVAPFLPVASACGAVFFLDYWIYKNDPLPRRSPSPRVIGHTGSPGILTSCDLDGDTMDQKPASFDSTPAPL